MLFRGGEEKDCRQHFIQDGWLEAVIGLPAGLFYGTGIPACVLVLDKAGAASTMVLFINADREYREGKAQNFLRPEDVEKIVHVYRNRREVPGYARLVPMPACRPRITTQHPALRRQRPPPEPQDVRAHLHGGVPTAEVERLQPYFASYAGLREELFLAIDPAGGSYLAFHPTLRTRDPIKRTVEAAPGVAATHATFHQALDDWWRVSVSAIEGLAHSNNVFDLRRRFVDTIAAALTPLGLLNVHEVRGAMANYFKTLEADSSRLQPAAETPS